MRSLPEEEYTGRSCLEAVLRILGIPPNLTWIPNPCSYIAPCREGELGLQLLSDVQLTQLLIFLLQGLKAASLKSEVTRASLLGTRGIAARSIHATTVVAPGLTTRNQDATN